MTFSAVLQAEVPVAVSTGWREGQETQPEGKFHRLPSVLHQWIFVWHGSSGCQSWMCEISKGNRSVAGL